MSYENIATSDKFSAFSYRITLWIWIAAVFLADLFAVPTVACALSTDNYEQEAYNPEAPGITQYRHFIPRIQTQRPNLIGLTSGDMDTQNSRGSRLMRTHRRKHGFRHTNTQAHACPRSVCTQSFISSVSVQFQICRLNSPSLAFLV